MPEQTSRRVLFDIRQSGERWECRPAGAWSHFGFAFSLLGAGFCSYISGMFFWNSGDSIMGITIGAVLLVAAAMLVWQALRFWRLRRIPLTIEHSGRVSYDDKELCPAGSVRTVQILSDPQGSGECKVVLEQIDGRRVDLDGPYFGAVAQREAANVLAEELAKALKVTVVEAENGA
jgi:hypothetical protein